jgi:hypothetical protein
VGAPTKLTDELRVAVERDLAAGVPVAVAAQSAGVGRRTLHRWLDRGLVVRRGLAAAAEPGPTLDERLDQAEEPLVAIIVAAAKRGSWQAALALLERRWPDRWARPPRRQPETGPPAPLAGDRVLDELDEIRRRRRPP